MSEIVIRRLSLDQAPWREMDGFSDRTVLQTREWLGFVAESQRATPVVAEVLEEGSRVGFFTGLVIRKLGLAILGSPFEGWTTPYMGFNLPPGRSRGPFLEPLRRFAFRELGCHYLELVDRWTSPDDMALADPNRYYPTHEIDLSRGEEALFAAMTSACRRCIRKAEKSGVVIEEARDDGFADEYYDQLIDVFAKQGLRPTYGRDRVSTLVRHLQPTGRLLLLRARSPEGKCIATGIFPALGKVMHFWGGASWRAHQNFRPNELLMWHAMRHWRNRGVVVFDMGGAGSYKLKYGSVEVRHPRFVHARWAWLVAGRDLARAAWRLRHRLQGRSGSNASTASADPPGEEDSQQG